VNGLNVGEILPLYVRDNMAGEMHKLQIPVTTYARLYNCDDSTVYMQHTASGEPIIFENIDTLILCTGHESIDDLADQLDDNIEIHRAGDCLAPRSAEEAIYEGMKVGWAIKF